MSGISRPTTVVVMGMMGRTPFAGVAWQAAHYLEGLRRLGHDVWYVEDTGDWPYDPLQNSITADCTYTTNFIAQVLDRCQLPGRWAYRAAAQEGQVFGLSATQLADLYRRAGALVNVTGATLLRQEHLRVPVRIYLETDPVLPQVEVAQGRQFTIDLLAAHTHHFSYGENLGAPDCGVPVGRFRYWATRQPIILDWWTPLQQENGSRPFTTVASWEQKAKDLEWNGATYSWSKHLEFLKFIDLPRRTRQPLELALACGDAAAVALLKGHGWGVVDALTLTRDLDPYRDYLRRSAGEFTVAKDQNIRLRSGWFSDRSASYLAAGRPVITQDTGFGNVLPTGRGLFAFRTIEEVLAAFDTIAADYAGHCRAAREIAHEYFAAESVLGRMLEQAGI